ncbi:MAG: hypothetical protein HY819_07475 [Acidobacteria bacterium]|nr:hypothetical protein [Acidobacteriota bacterium]
MKQKLIPLRLLLTFFALILIIIFYSVFPKESMEAAEFSELAAIKIGNQLQVTIPSDELSALKPTALLVEVLDAENKTIARQLLDPNQEKANGWKINLSLPTDLKQEDLFWYRLRYGFIEKGQTTSSNAKIQPISKIFHFPTVRLLGQKEFISGANNSLRVLVIDGQSGKALKGSMSVSLDKPNSSDIKTTAKVDQHGTASLELKTPQYFTGDANLTVSVNTPLGTQEIVEKVQVIQKENILLTTDKPIYQPGHLVHIRSLALDRFSRQAVSNSPIIFEIEDAKGNKVFKKRSTTDEFGIASTEFQLAEEVNMGTFKLRTILGDENNRRATTQEKSFVVDRYVLPKFKIDIKMQGGEDERQQKKYYSPGETVSGKITAKYLFGKPISRGRLSIKMSTFDVETVEIGKDEAILSETGEYNFAMKLPNSFAGRSFEQGAAPVALQVEITDTANHTETRSESLLISNNPILITAVPESGDIVPRLNNRVYLLTAYPDGSPAKTTITTNIKPANLVTDKDGIAIIEVDGQLNSLSLTAKDERGKVGTTNISLKRRDIAGDSLMLRTPQALYRVGEKLEITTISTRPKGSVYIDIIKDRQTISTRALELDNGKATTSLDLTPDLFGTIEVRAYIFGRNADPVSDRRLIFVDPADDLQIETKIAKESFRPGEEAQIEMTVKDKLGRAKPAVLDVQVVDEAVFALSEKQPGLEKVFFYLEQELLKPRYEIHSHNDTHNIVPVVNNEDQEALIRRERAAKVLLAAASEVNVYSLRKEQGRDVYEAKAPEYYSKYYQLMNTQLQKVVAGINKYYVENKSAKTDLIAELPKIAQAHYIAKQDLIDPLGQEFKLVLQSKQDSYSYYQFESDWYSSNPSPKFYFPIYGQKQANVSIVFYLNAYYGHQIRTRNGVRVEGLVRPEVMGDVVEVAAAPANRPARAMDLDANIDKKALSKTESKKSKDDAKSAETQASAGEGGGDVKVRSYFPETLYVNPKLVTDKNGRVLVRVPLADSITTWRMTMLASTKQGALGSSTAGIKVFQDFFIDLDLPVSLTQDDTVSIPVAVYNYLGDTQDVELKLKQEDWFTLVDDNPIKQVRVGSGEVTASSYRIQAKKLGLGKLTVFARLTNRDSIANGDAISRQIEILPNGEQQNITVNDRLENSISKEILIPETAIVDASKILVKFYPGPLSQVVEGLDSMLRMPSGCFEQTSATTYPNILVLDYMKTTKKITPEIQVKAEGFISTGYQRLVTYEVPGGGFSWFGQAPANKILTSFGLMEFYDMAKVHEVDPRVIERTQNWLASEQKADGSWAPDTQFIDEGATNNFHNDQVRITAYIAWALAYSGYKGEAITRAKNFIDKNLNGQEDAYTLAILSNFAIDSHQDQPWVSKMFNALVAKAAQEDKTALWKQEGKTPTYSHGAMADIETTALAAQALIKWGGNNNLATKALKYLTDKKDAYGNWHSTQATILSLKAFILSQQKAGGGETQGIISVNINGQKVSDLEINKDNNELMHQLDLKAYTQFGSNKINISFVGKGSMLYQIVGRYYRTWSRSDDVATIEPLSISVKYDRSTLAQDDIATTTVTIRNNTSKPANMVMIDLGIPPGFEIFSEDFQELIPTKPTNKIGSLTKFTVTPKQVILYFDGLQAKQNLTFNYRLRAKYPIKAKTTASKVYQYYNPEVSATAKPENIMVVEKRR